MQLSHAYYVNRVLSQFNCINVLFSLSSVLPCSGCDSDIRCLI